MFLLSDWLAYNLQVQYALYTWLFMVCTARYTWIFPACWRVYFMIYKDVINCAFNVKFYINHFKIKLQENAPHSEMQPNTHQLFEASKYHRGWRKNFTRYGQSQIGYGHDLDAGRTWNLILLLAGVGGLVIVFEKKMSESHYKNHTLWFVRAAFQNEWCNTPWIHSELGLDHGTL